MITTLTIEIEDSVIERFREIGSMGYQLTTAETRMEYERMKCIIARTVSAVYAQATMKDGFIVAVK
jgi:hypothetical protein